MLLKLNVVDDINDTSHELRPQDSISNSGLWLTRNSLGHELRVVDAIYRSQFFIT